MMKDILTPNQLSEFREAVNDGKYIFGNPRLKRVVRTIDTLLEVLRHQVVVCDSKKAIELIKWYSD